MLNLDGVAYAGDTRLYLVTNVSAQHLIQIETCVVRQQHFVFKLFNVAATAATPLFRALRSGSMLRQDAPKRLLVKES